MLLLYVRETANKLSSFLATWFELNHVLNQMYAQQ